jgi:hypothetical protein
MSEYAKKGDSANKEMEKSIDCSQVEKPIYD